VRSLIALAVGLVVAAASGITTAWFAVDQGHIFGSVQAGTWTAWPSSGGLSADPYAMAALARTGELRLGAGEGITFIADADQAGIPLTGNCVYELSGETPAARLWTLSAYDEAGRLMANPARRMGFHSGEIVRAEDGGMLITVSAEVAPGNWLPVGTSGPFRLLLRLYDTPLATGSQIGDLVMPGLSKVGCR